MGHKNLNKVPVSRKSFGKGVSLGIIEGMVAAPAFNATHQTSWLHLCGENPWTVLPWPLQFTRGLGRCLMGQVLKWWTEQSTNGGPWSKLYNVRDPPRKGGGEKICRENTVALRTATVIKSKRNIFKNYSPWTLLRKNFCAPHFSIHCFSLLSYYL